MIGRQPSPIGPGPVNRSVPTPIRRTASRAVARPAPGRAGVLDPCAAWFRTPSARPRPARLLGPIPAGIDRPASRRSGRRPMPVSPPFALRFVHGTCQSSTTRPGTRLNSAVLCVTSVQPFASAIAAISMSLPPMVCPRAARSARIRSYGSAAASSNGSERNCHVCLRAAQRMMESCNAPQ